MKVDEKTSGILKQAGSLLMPPSEVADILGIDRQVFRTLFFDSSSEVFKAYNVGKLEFKMHYENFILKVALRLGTVDKIDKNSIDALEKIRNDNKKNSEVEEREYYREIGA